MANVHGLPERRRGNGAAQVDVERLRTLDDLETLSPEQLATLYAGGRPPQLGVLAGHARGRLLSVPALHAVPVVGALLDRLLIRAAALPLNPWRGKTFAAPAEHHRTSGDNDVLGRALLPFDAHVEKSALDHAPALIIRYARPENPRLLRPVVDELREVARGLWLGPSYVRGPNGPRILVWFAVAKG
ncbi:MAG: hypothetical protein HYV09_22815 [Deltaproteobacteria bacterium]|nr:hypothetical protein [Deltaproteobacteria bacterium]